MFFKKIRNKLDEKNRQLAICEIKDRIQIREYEGKLYICYDYQPLIEQDKLKGDICENLEKIRNNVITYKKLA